MQCDGVPRGSMLEHIYFQIFNSNDIVVCYTNIDYTILIHVKMLLCVICKRMFVTHQYNIKFY